ncbi:metal cation transporter, ZIP family [Brevibacterium mcbrellneri ATCC 49030]|uniref:Metal cation transporter, ZIP family n=1 Tax=Brevibacterium mcbrellneri ATCC 49030 TaxID=585530 RepID=D4YPU6_9MICO|nr:zinc transporter ZupT [Brevibacterium mcbrellneri]EFG46772.1 metal cation transporter, ZIP family [Brevibacterium mcbrellneri ATCC 49030]
MEFVVPFLMSMAAGLATGLGALLGVTNLARSARFFSGALGFSAGVMIYVSLVEILPEAIESVENPAAPWIAVGALFGGIVFAAVIDALVPDHINPSTTTTSDVRLLRMGVFTAIAIALHNFPEGFATFLTALTDHTLAIPIVVAIAIHNIPEGLAVAVPILHATGSVAKAFRWALLSGLAEPAGAVLGYLILAPFMTPTIFGIVFAGVGGIMVYISFSQLLPAAHNQGHPRAPLFGLFAGMAVMALSLLMLG